MTSMVSRLATTLVAVTAVVVLVLGGFSSPAAAQDEPAPPPEAPSDGGGSGFSIPRPVPESATELDGAWSKLSNLTWRGVQFAFAIAAGFAVFAVLLGHLGTHGGAAMASRTQLMSIAGGALLAGTVFSFINFMINIGSGLWT